MDDPSLSGFLLFADAAQNLSSEAFSLSIPASLMIVALLLLVNGYFVALEFALVALRRTRVNEMVSQNIRGAQSVQRGKDRVDDFVAAAQLGITVASLALGMVAEGTVLQILNQWFDIQLSHETGMGFFISITVVTVLHVVLGEQVPKMLAIDRPGPIALLTAPPAEVFLKVCGPAISLLSWMTSIVLIPFGVNRKGGLHAGEIYSEEEIEALLVSRQDAGLAEAAENEMISRVFLLFELVATQIMIPRTEIVFISASATIREVMQIASEEGHDRYPVYGENSDEIVGILLMKDLVSYLGRNPDGLEHGISELCREALFVPGSLPCAQLLTQLKEKRTRLAIVLDEYGGTAGMLTLGDVLERIVGEVDEEDEEIEPQDLIQINDRTFSLSGLMLTEDVEKVFKIEIDDDLNDTIGGVVFSALGRAPAIGDSIELKDLKFQVEALDGLRIDRLLVTTEQKMP